MCEEILGETHQRICNQVRIATNIGGIKLLILLKLVLKNCVSAQLSSIVALFGAY